MEFTSAKVIVWKALSSGYRCPGICQLIYKYRSITLKVKISHLTGREKIYGGMRFDRKIGQNLGLPYEILRSRPVLGFLWG